MIFKCYDLDEQIVIVQLIDQEVHESTTRKGSEKM